MSAHYELYSYSGFQARGRGGGSFFKPRRISGKRRSTSQTRVSFATGTAQLASVFLSFPSLSPSHPGSLLSHSQSVPPARTMFAAAPLRTLGLPSPTPFSSALHLSRTDTTTHAHRGLRTARRRFGRCGFRKSFAATAGQVIGIEEHYDGKGKVVPKPHDLPTPETRDTEPEALYPTLIPDTRYPMPHSETLNPRP